MQNQPNSRAAKEFLVRCITEQAQREGTPLTDTERDMLYFSETHWTLPNIFDVNRVFERDYNPAEYELKIAQLIRNLKLRTNHDDRAQLEEWNRAVNSLRFEDHYVLVMIRAAEIAVSEPSRSRRLLQLSSIAVIGGIAALLITFAILFIANR